MQLEDSLTNPVIMIMILVAILVCYFIGSHWQHSYIRQLFSLFIFRKDDIAPVSILGLTRYNFLQNRVSWHGPVVDNDVWL